MSNKEQFEKYYTDAFISEELKGLEWVIFAVNGDGEYLQDKAATAYAIWQARVPEGYVVVPVDPNEDMIMAGCMEHGGYDVIDSKSIYKSMIESEK